jgi:hypothetical protein
MYLHANAKLGLAGRLAPQRFDEACFAQCRSPGLPASTTCVRR